jgi:hypothetical protein
MCISAPVSIDVQIRVRAHLLKPAIYHLLPDVPAAIGRTARAGTSRSPET